MIDKSNMLFTRVKNAVSSLCPNVNQLSIGNSPPTLPFLHFNQVDNPETASDLDGNENAVKPMIEITVYTQGETRLTDGKKIMSLADTQMKSMGFIRTFGPQQVSNINDTTILRLLSRYTRIIGSGDVF